MEVVFLLRI